MPRCERSCHGKAARCSCGRGRSIIREPRWSQFATTFPISQQMKGKIISVTTTSLAIVCLAVASWLVAAPQVVVSKSEHFFKAERITVSVEKPNLYRYPTPKAGGWQNLEHPACVLLEGTTPLTRVHSTAAAERLGHQVFAVGGKTVWFASTDGSDPRKNGRNYTLVVPVTLPRHFALWFLLAGIACGLHPGSRFRLGRLGKAFLQGPDSQPQYYPALDGLRAVAAISVFLGHFAPEPLMGLASYGDAGVIVFFVLSGFLITNILLRERERSDFCLKTALKTFYIRRGLRIFPLYYAAIAICFVLGEPSVRQKLFSLLTFNLPGIPPVMGDYGSLAHFWSLFVEEQFYLLWPLIIWKAPRAWLLPLLVVIPVASFGLKHSLAFAGFEYRWIFSSVFCCADHLGAGALLAFVMRYHPSILPRRSIWIVVAAMVPVAIMSYIRLSDSISPSFVGHLSFGCVMHTAWTVAGVALVAALTDPPRALAWLACSPLRFLGRISYGLYVYHFMVPFLQDKLSLGHNPTPWSECAYRGLLTLALATASWFLMESPLLNLKARFAPSGLRKQGD